MEQLKIMLVQRVAVPGFNLCRQRRCAAGARRSHFGSPLGVNGSKIEALKAVYSKGLCSPYSVTGDQTRDGDGRNCART
jgi:hypothetical protein